jgi:hypothetical protein
VIAAGVTRAFAESDLSEEALEDLKIDVAIGISQADRGGNRSVINSLFA